MNCSTLAFPVPHHLPTTVIIELISAAGAGIRAVHVTRRDVPRSASLFCHGLWGLIFSDLVANILEIGVPENGAYAIVF